MYAFSLGMQKSVKTYSLYIVRQFWVYMPSPIVLRYFSIYVSNCADLRSPASIVSYFDCDLENLISVSFLTTCSTCLPLLQRCVKCSLKVRKLNREPTNVHTLTSLALTLPSSNKHFDYLILSTYKLHEIYLQILYTYRLSEILLKYCNRIAILFVNYNTSWDFGPQYSSHLSLFIFI